MSSMLTLEQKLSQLYVRAQKTKKDIRYQEIKWLVCDLLNWQVHDLILQKDYQLSPQELENLDSAFEKLLAGTPLSRITQRQEFFGLSFGLNSDTLDPRQDTEIIPDIIQKRFGGKFTGPFIDLGTGSGCLAISVLYTNPDSLCLAVDLSWEACRQAYENAQYHKCEGRFLAICGDWAESIKGKVPLILSNPPYIPSTDIESLDENVREFDPILALDGGKDGFDAIKKILNTLKTILLPHGFALIEIGYNQLNDMQRLIEKYGLDLSDVHLDSAGIPRVVEISYGDK